MPQHLKYDLGTVKRGSTVVVTLKNQANVQLMTASQYRNYQAGRRYRYTGGGAKTSPVRLSVPSTDHWYVALDLGGLAGKIQAGVQVVPPPAGMLPTIREQSPLRDIQLREPVEPVGDVLNGQTWDVFISHASEDKAAVASPLRDALTELGVSVWLDKTELIIGDSLRRKIDQGIRSSRFGIVVFSKHFFIKGWTQHELDGLVGRSVAGQQPLLPIWHDLSADDVRNYSPSLADKIALSTADTTIEEMAAQIAAVVRPEPDQAA